MFKITETLGGRTKEELESVMSLNEFYQWREYFDIKRKAEKKAQKEARMKSKAKSKRIRPRGG